MDTTNTVYGVNVHRSGTLYITNIGPGLLAVFQVRHILVLPLLKILNDKYTTSHLILEGSTLILLHLPKDTFTI